MRGRVKFVVDGFADEVNAEGGDTETKARNGVAKAELVTESGVLPPLIAPLEKLPRRSQGLRHFSYLFLSLLLPLSFSLLTKNGFP